MASFPSTNSTSFIAPRHRQTSCVWLSPRILSLTHTHRMYPDGHFLLGTHTNDRTDPSCVLNYGKTKQNERKKLSTPARFRFSQLFFLPFSCLVVMLPKTKNSDLSDRMRGKNILNLRMHKFRSFRRLQSANKRDFKRALPMQTGCRCWYTFLTIFGCHTLKYGCSRLEQTDENFASCHTIRTTIAFLTLSSATSML